MFYDHSTVESWNDVLVIPERFETIGYASFYGVKVSKIVLPSHLKSIATYAFDFSTAKEVVFTGTEPFTIGKYAFCYNSNLTSINLQCCTSIGDYAFYKCKSLTELNLPQGLTSIGAWAFVDCLGVQVLNYDAIDCSTENIYVNSYDYYPFQWFIDNEIVANIPTINIGPHVKKLHSDIFRNSGNSVYHIPSNVEYIAGYETKEYNAANGDAYGDPAFCNDTLLKDIYCDWNYDENSELDQAAPWSNQKGITVHWNNYEHTYN